jgi:glucose/arabinose dehydrogenase
MRSALVWRHWVWCSIRNTSCRGGIWAVHLSDSMAPGTAGRGAVITWSCVLFADGQPVGTPEDVLTGFVHGEGNALGRPVGVAVDQRGALLVADDVGNVVWQVAPAAAAAR